MLALACLSLTGYALTRHHTIALAQCLEGRPLATCQYALNR